MIRVAIFVFSLFVFLYTESAQIFEHTSNFNRAMSQKYTELKKLSNNDVITCFLQCCKNEKTIDSEIKNELHNIVSNIAGRNTLLIVTARLLPYVKCADSLETLLQAIPQNEVADQNDKLRKAELVSLFFKTLGITGSKSVSNCISNISNLLDTLKDSPVLFPMPIAIQGVCNEVFSGYSTRRTKSVDRINRCWNKDVHDAVFMFLPVLREGMFTLVRGNTTQYKYAHKMACAQICLSKKNPIINARCITGPLLCNRIDGIDVPTCYHMSDKSISAASGLHHEIFII